MSNDIIMPPGMDDSPQQPTAQMRINPGELDDVVCEECNNFTFVQVVLMKRMPSLISPTGKEAFIPMQVYACNACGHINERFIKGMGGWFKGKGDPEAKDEGTVVEQEAADAIEGSKLEGLHAVTPTPPELSADDENDSHALDTWEGEGGPPSLGDEETINICEHGIVVSDGICPECDNGTLGG